MEGDSCSIHKNKMAIGFYSTPGMGLNGCKECIPKERFKASPYTKVTLYDFDIAFKKYVKNKLFELKAKAALIEDNDKPLRISSGSGDNVTLYGIDKLEYLFRDDIEYEFCYFNKWKDKRTRYYDSSD